MCAYKCVCVCSIIFSCVCAASSTAPICFSASPCSACASDSKANASAQRPNFFKDWFQPWLMRGAVESGRVDTSGDGLLRRGVGHWHGSVSRKFSLNIVYNAFTLFNQFSDSRVDPEKSNLKPTKGNKNQRYKGSESVDVYIVSERDKVVANLPHCNVSRRTGWRYETEHQKCALEEQVWNRNCVRVYCSLRPANKAWGGAQINKAHIALPWLFIAAVTHACSAPQRPGGYTQQSNEQGIRGVYVSLRRPSQWVLVLVGVGTVVARLNESHVETVSVDVQHKKEKETESTWKKKTGFHGYRLPHWEVSKGRAS